MAIDLKALRKRLKSTGQTIESRLLHLSDPEGDGPVVPDIPASSMYQAKDAATLAGRFQSIIDSDPPVDRFIPDGAATIYLRLGSHVEWKLAEALALAQGGESAIMFSDGMRAIASSVCFRLHAGAEMIAGVPLYGCTDNLFTNTIPRMGVKVHFVRPDDTDEIAARINRRTRVVYLETISNPSLTMPDLAAVKELLAGINAGRFPGEKITLVIDNTFATPYGCNPHELGPQLDDMIVVHSTTKGINGFSAGLGGVAIIPWAYWKDLFLYRKDHGGSLSPEQAHHLLTKSLRTLGLRVRKMQENAAAMAALLEAHNGVKQVFYPGLPSFPQHALEAHNGVKQVFYPGLPSFPQHALAKQSLRDWYGEFAPGHMVSFVMKGRTAEVAERRGRALMDHLAANSDLFVVAVSLGYIGTLIEDPNGGTHATIGPEERKQKGIIPGLIRLSAGIEHADDLQRDLLAALDRAARS
jgi:cystathionine beta-lyase/cystathionine gamma-synthase